MTFSELFRSVSPINSNVDISILYSRYLNHVSHLATKEIGGPALPMYKLASHVSVPDWIVNLRHEASHGTALPSIEVLRLAADFIKDWLKVCVLRPCVRLGSLYFM